MRYRKNLKKPAYTAEQKLESLLRAFVPVEYTKYFDFVSINNDTEIIEFEFEEREDLLPKDLIEEKQIVLDGFCNPITILFGSFLNKKMYLLIKRRRWKRGNTNEHYSNEYDLHPKGVKITQNFGAFLKGGD